MNAPFRIEYDENISHDDYYRSYTIYDSQNNIVIFAGTYSGDGDAEINLNWQDATELVNLINKGAE